MHSWLCQHSRGCTASPLPCMSLGGAATGPFHHSLISWLYHYPKCTPDEAEDWRGHPSCCSMAELTDLLLRGMGAGGQGHTGPGRPRVPVLVPPFPSLWRKTGDWTRTPRYQPTGQDLRRAP